MAGADLPTPQIQPARPVSHSSPLVLASGSPQRRHLLSKAGYAFRVIAPPAEAEDDPREQELPAALVCRLARQKAEHVASTLPNGIVVGCDTVAAVEDRILGKPRDADDARAMLSLLSGREHQVYSGLCLIRAPRGAPLVRIAETRLRMDSLSTAQIDEYLASGLWQGKAGAFGYQDRAGWLHLVQGSPSNVIGLPLELLSEMLRDV